MPRRTTTTRAACATLATLAALLIGGSGAANANAVPQASVGYERAIWSDVDRSTQVALGRNQPCPQGRVCLYEHRNFNRDQDGRMLQFRDRYWQQLSRWGFNDKTSSWKNRMGRDACLSKHWRAGNALLRLEAGASSAGMGSWNDEASGVKAERC